METEPAKFLLDIEMTKEGVSIASAIEGKGIYLVSMICAAIKDEPKIIDVFRIVVEMIDFQEESEKPIN